MENIWRKENLHRDYVEHTTQPLQQNNNHFDFFVFSLLEKRRKKIERHFSIVLTQDNLFEEPTSII